MSPELLTSHETSTALERFKSEARTVVETHPAIPPQYRPYMLQSIDRLTTVEPNPEAFTLQDLDHFERRTAEIGSYYAERMADPETFYDGTFAADVRAWLAGDLTRSTIEGRFRKKTRREDQRPEPEGGGRRAAEDRAAEDRLSVGYADDLDRLRRPLRAVNAVRRPRPAETSSWMAERSVEDGFDETGEEPALPEAVAVWWRAVADRLTALRAGSADTRARLDLLAGLEHRTRTPDETIAAAELRLASEDFEVGSGVPDRAAADRTEMEAVLLRPDDRDAASEPIRNAAPAADGPPEPPAAPEPDGLPDEPLAAPETDAWPEYPIDRGLEADSSQPVEAAPDIPGLPVGAEDILGLRLSQEIASELPSDPEDILELPLDQELPLGLESGSDSPLIAIPEPLENEALPELEAFTPEDSLDSVAEPLRLDGGTTELPRLEPPAAFDETDPDHTFLFPERLAVEDNQDDLDPEAGRLPESLSEPADRIAPLELPESDLVHEPLTKPGFERIAAELDEPDRSAPALLELPELPVSPADSRCIRISSTERYPSGLRGGIANPVGRR